MATTTNTAAIDTALLSQHSAAGGKAAISVNRAALTQAVNSSNTMLQDCTELINNSKAKKDKRNADNIEVLVDFGCRATTLSLLDDGVGQEGPDQFRSLSLGDGSNQNRESGETSQFVYSNKGLGRHSVMVRRSETPFELTKSATSKAYYLVALGDARDGSKAAARVQVMLPESLLESQTSDLSGPELTALWERSVRTLLLQNLGMLLQHPGRSSAPTTNAPASNSKSNSKPAAPASGGANSKASGSKQHSKAATNNNTSNTKSNTATKRANSQAVAEAMVLFKAAARGLFQEYGTPGAPLSLPQVLALCRLIGPHGNLTHLQLRPSCTDTLRLDPNSGDLLVEYDNTAVAGTERFKPLTQLLSDMYVHTKIVRALDPGFYSRTALLRPSAVKISVGQFAWRQAGAAAASGGGRVGGSGAGNNPAAAAAAAAGGGGGDAEGQQGELQFERFGMQQVVWGASPAPEPLFPNLEPLVVKDDAGNVLCRCQLFKSPAPNQVLQQRLIPFYSDIQLSVRPKTQPGYHQAMSIINTTTFGNSGKGIPSTQRDLQHLANQLTQLYGRDLGETIQLLEDTMTRFRNYGCRFDGKGMSQSWKHRLQQLSGGFTLYASVDPQLVTLNQAKDDLAAPGLFWSKVFEVVGAVLYDKLRADLEEKRASQEAASAPAPAGAAAAAPTAGSGGAAAGARRDTSGASPSSAPATPAPTPAAAAAGAAAGASPPTPAAAAGASSPAAAAAAAGGAAGRRLGPHRRAGAVAAAAIAANAAAAAGARASTGAVAGGSGELSSDEDTESEQDDGNGSGMRVPGLTAAAAAAAAGQSKGSKQAGPGSSSKVVAAAKRKTAGGSTNNNNTAGSSKLKRQRLLQRSAAAAAGAGSGQAAGNKQPSSQGRAGTPSSTPPPPAAATAAAAGGVAGTGTRAAAIPVLTPGVKQEQQTGDLAVDAAAIAAAAGGDGVGVVPSGFVAQASVDNSSGVIVIDDSDDDEGAGERLEQGNQQQQQGGVRQAADPMDVDGGIAEVGTAPAQAAAGAGAAAMDASGTAATGGTASLTAAAGGASSGRTVANVQDARLLTAADTTRLARSSAAAAAAAGGAADGAGSSRGDMMQPAATQQPPRQQQQQPPQTLQSALDAFRVSQLESRVAVLEATVEEQRKQLKATQGFQQVLMAQLQQLQRGQQQQQQV